MSAVRRGGLWWVTRGPVTVVAPKLAEALARLPAGALHA